jgi:hypothetical protein
MDISALSEQQCKARCFELIGILHDKIEHLVKVIETQGDEIWAMRSALDLLDVKMRKYFQMETTDLKKLPTDEIISRTQTVCDLLTGPGSSKEFIRIKALNEMVQGVLPDCPKEDPYTYIPIMCSEMMLQASSVNSLRPFIDLLDKVFGVYNGDVERLKPCSRSFGQIEEMIIEMQVLLKSIRPVNINPIVFSMLQKTSVFMAAVINAVSRLKEEAFVTQDLDVDL